jgi:hypothetical protein
VWLHLPADSAVPASLGLSIRGFDLALFVQPAGFSATADCAEVQAAVQLQQSFANWRKQHTLDPAAPIEPGDTQLWQDLDAQPHGCMESPRARLALSRRLQQVRCEILGSKVKWSFDAATLDMFELVQLYRAFAWLLNGR